MDRVGVGFAEVGLGLGRAVLPADVLPTGEVPAGVLPTGEVLAEAWVDTVADGVLVTEASAVAGCPPDGPTVPR